MGGDKGQDTYQNALDFMKYVVRNREMNVACLGPVEDARRIPREVQGRHD